VIIPVHNEQPRYKVHSKDPGSPHRSRPFQNNSIPHLSASEKLETEIVKMRHPSLVPRPVEELSIAFIHIDYNVHCPHANLQMVPSSELLFPYQRMTPVEVFMDKLTNKVYKPHTTTTPKCSSAKP